MSLLYHKEYSIKTKLTSILLVSGILFMASAMVSAEEPDLHVFAESVVDLATCGLAIPSNTERIDVSMTKNSAVIARESLRKLSPTWAMTVPRISVAQADLEAGFQLTTSSGQSSESINKSCRVYSTSWGWKNLDPPEYFFGHKNGSEKIKQTLKKLGAKAVEDPMTCSSNVLLMFGLDFEENPERIKEMLNLLKQGKNVMVFGPFKGKLPLEALRDCDYSLSSSHFQFKKSPLEKMHRLQGQGMEVQCDEGKPGVVFLKAEKNYASMRVGQGPFLTFTSIDFVRESESPLLLAYLLHTMKDWEMWNKDWFNELYETKN